jgi:hypothetical protein
MKIERQMKIRQKAQEKWLKFHVLESRHLVSTRTMIGRLIPP